MKQTFIVDTQEDIFEFERLLRTIITLIYPDWKEYIKQLADELDVTDMEKCPECEENIYKYDYYCRWCGYKLKQENEDEHK